MANITRTLADTAGFIPQSWANEALDVLRKNIVVARYCAKDSDFTDAGWKGKSLTVPYPGTFVAQPKAAGALATVQTPANGTSVTLTLATHQTVDFILEDVAFNSAQNGVSMMENYGEAAGIAIAEQLETDLMSLYPQFSLPSSGAINANINYAAVVAARKALTDGKAPQSNRALILSTKDYAAALQDTSLLGYFQFNNDANNAAAIAGGSVRRVAGFDVFESQFIPSQVVGTPANNIQTVTIAGGATGGTFTLTYGAQTTTAIPFNSTAPVVEAALQALSSLGAGLARVSGPATGVYTVEILAAVPTAITGSAAGLTGGTPTLTPGVAAAGTTATNNLAFHKNAIMLAVRWWPRPARALRWHTPATRPAA